MNYGVRKLESYDIENRTRKICAICRGELKNEEIIFYLYDGNNATRREFHIRCMHKFLTTEEYNIIKRQEQYKQHASSSIHKVMLYGEEEN